MPGATVLRGEASKSVGSVEHDSRAVRQGALFVAIPGFTVDGHDFLGQAADAGAAAVLVQQDRPESWSNLAEDITVVGVAEPRVALAQAASWFEGHPGREMTVIGITGTDGKTTTSHLLTTVLEAGGAKVGRLGTVDFYITGEATDADASRMSTPEAPSVQRSMRRMADAGCTHAVVESTSHGLVLNRLDGVEYDIAAFTNITGDHLDFHETFEAYREAKGMLFAALARTTGKSNAQAAIVNADDPSASMMLALTDARPIQYGLDVHDLDVTARNVVLRPDGSDFSLVTPGGVTETFVNLPAKFNVLNALAAAAVGVGLGLSTERIGAGLAACEGVPGRMERIHSGQAFEVIVDYAHTGDAVRKVLEVLRDVTRGRLIIVVGAAGDRDPGRRFGVGRAAAEGADFAIFTNEDPRLEDPAAIVREIAAHAEGVGRKRGRDFVEVEDRRAAIARAFAEAGDNDVVVICGKGHEQSIIYGDEVLPWDDREVAREELRALNFVAD